MLLKKLFLPYFMTGHFQCSIDNTFFTCDGIDRMPLSASTRESCEVYILKYTSKSTNKTVGKTVVSFTQLDEEVYFLYEGFNYELTVINKGEMHLTNGVNNFVITRIEQ